jgi:hypothetical protein
VRITVELIARLEARPDNLNPISVEDIEVDSRGDFFLLDSKSRHVLKYDQKGKFLFALGKRGAGEQEFIHPDDILVDGRDFVYVLDGPQKKVSKFSSGGAFLDAIEVDLKYSGLRLRGTLGPDDQIILAGYKNGKIFHVYDSNGRPVTSFGNLLQPINPPPSNWRLESTYIAETLFFSGGVLYCTHPFRYELVRYDFAAGKALPTIPLQSKVWRDAELREGGIIIHTAAAKTLVDRQGRVYNLMESYSPGRESKHFLVIADKNGKQIGGEHETKYCAMAIDRNDGFYLISNGSGWTLTRVKFTFH